MEKHRDRTEFGRRLVESRKRAGLTQVQVCAQLGISQGTLSELEREAYSSTYTAQLASLYRVDPYWLATGEAAPYGAAIARATALQQPTGSLDQRLIQSVRQTPLLMSWERVAKMEQIPDEFELELPDAAMAPMAPAGTRIRLRKAAQAVPGEGVLIRDRRGHTHFRECRLRADGGWNGYAYNPAFPTLHDADDGLQVLAVTAGVTIGWQQLVRPA